MAQSFQSFIDDTGRLKQWPAKHEMQKAAIQYISEKFDNGVIYTEKDVNEILKGWHTFDDYFILRRSLVEFGYLIRKRDGSAYWKNPTPPSTVE